MQSNFPGAINPTDGKIIIRSIRDICLNLYITIKHLCPQMPKSAS